MVMLALHRWSQTRPEERSVQIMMLHVKKSTNQFPWPTLQQSWYWECRGTFCLIAVWNKEFHSIEELLKIFFYLIFPFVIGILQHHIHSGYFEKHSCFFPFFPLIPHALSFMYVSSQSDNCNNVGDDSNSHERQ